MSRRGLAVGLAGLLLAGCTRSGSPVVGPSPPASPAPTGSATATTAAPAPGAGARRPDPAAAYPRQRLDWRGCGDGFECATLRVPLDYARPGGRRIEVAVIRLRARARDGRRIGSVVLNPGGPGGSGVAFARQAREVLPARVRDRFDVVSFDPRGVARSTSVDCLGDAEMDRLLATDPSPDSPEEKRALVAVSRGQAAGCARRSGHLLAHLGTVDAARDMEVLRNALGDPKLTYVGFSYGTVLGGRYAELFPDRVRALVLDGAVDVGLDTLETALGQAKGFDRALGAFLDHCAGSPSCGFRRQGDLRRAYDELMARIDRSPLPASRYPRRRLGPGEALYGVAAGLYSRQWGWPALAQGLTQAQDGDGSTLLALFDGLVERDSRGRYSNAMEALVAIGCVDGEHPKDVAAFDAAARRFARAAPRFGPALAYGSLPCAFWPVPPATRSGPVRAPGSPPILVVGTTGDPATPYAWSEALARQLPRGRLLTYDGDGHTAYGYGRSACVERIVDAYLLRLELPPPGARC